MKIFLRLEKVADPNLMRATFTNPENQIIKIIYVKKAKKLSKMVAEALNEDQ